MLTIVNNTVITNLKVAKRVDLKCSFHTQKNIVIYEVMDMLTNLSVVPFCNIHLYQIIILLYTLNVYDVICQLHLNKAEKIQFNKMSPIQS